NVARNTLVVLRDPVPFVATVTNRAAATGGVDAESLENVKARGPLVLRSRDRAVTTHDYELLAREAAPEARRVHCVEADGDSPLVRVLVVPALGEHSGSEDDGLRFASLKPRQDTLDRIRDCLDARRCVGARVLVEPPFYQGVTVAARLRADPRTAAAAVRERALRALYGYLDPIGGGPQECGWPFGRRVSSGDIHAVLQRVADVHLVEDVLLFAADPGTGDRGDPVQRIELPAHGLVFSYAHQVRVLPA
ncbi:MAG TPA: putative baseplate assembly protein, partial [Micromonospora sp.]